MNIENGQIVKKELLLAENVLEKFNNTDDLVEMRQQVKESDDRLYLAWASVDVKDNQGQNVSMADIVKEQEIYMKRGGPIMDQHTNAPVGKVLGYKVMEHPVAKKTGVLYLVKFFNDNPRDDIAWNNIKSGNYTGLSFGGGFQNLSYRAGDDGDLFQYLTGVYQYETSVVEKPCNPFATGEAHAVLAKADSFLSKESEINNNSEVDVTMTENKIKKEDVAPPEENSEIAALKEAIAALAAEVAALKEAKEPEVEKSDVSEEEEKPEDKEMTKSVVAELKKSFSALTSEIKDLKKGLTKVETEKPSVADEIKKSGADKKTVDVAQQILKGEIRVNFKQLAKMDSGNSNSVIDAVLKQNKAEKESM